MVATGFPVVVVDYDCPEHVGEWVKANHPSVQVVEVKDRKLFNWPEACNIGAQAAVTAYEWLLFIAADALLRDPKLFVSFVSTLSTPRIFVIHKQPCGSLMGTFMVRRPDFFTVGGCDTVIDRYGAGYEEFECYARLSRAGYSTAHFPTGEMSLFQHIEHEGRTTYYQMKDRNESDRLNFLYYIIKHQILGYYPRTVMDLPQDYRVGLMDDLYSALQEAKDTKSPVAIEVVLPPQTFEQMKMTLARTLKFTVTI